MTISIPSDLEPFVTAVISQGDYQNETEVVTAALRLLEQQDRLKKDIRAGMESDTIPAEEAFQRLEEKARSLAERNP